MFHVEDHRELVSDVVASMKQLRYVMYFYVIDYLPGRQVRGR